MVRHADAATASLVRSRDSRATSASALRATSPPTTTTPRLDTAANHGNGPGCGRAASTGTIGSRPLSAPDQVTLLPSTTWKPGPATKDTAHSARLGRAMIWAVRRTTPPNAAAPTSLRDRRHLAPGQRDESEDDEQPDPEQRGGPPESGTHTAPDRVGDPGETEARTDDLRVVEHDGAKGQPHPGDRHEHRRDEQ